MKLTANPSHYIIPEWPVPNNVHAIVTTRSCGNLALHVNDDPQIVAANRQRLKQALALPEEPLWLEQVHGAAALNLDAPNLLLVGDASYTQTQQRICAILTADCLPIFFASRHGDEIAAAHAGWRGLAAGIIDQTIKSLQTPASDLLVWLGPAIGPDHFEVGAEVREKLIARHPDYAAGFYPTGPDKWLANFYQLAKINLEHCGAHSIYGGGLCTFCDDRRFYSYRRDRGVTGRMAHLIWLH